MRRAFFLVFLLAAAPFLVFSQTKNGDAKVLRELKRIDDEFHNAFRTADAATLNLLLADRFIWTHSTGEVQTKSELLADFKSGELKYESLETDDVKIYFYGKAAVANGRSTRKYPNQDAFQIRYSVFYVKQRGKWQAVAFHTTILPKIKELSQQAVPVYKEPHHQLKFENEYVRVLDVIIPPKESTLFHTHTEDMVGVTISDAPTLSEKPDMPPTNSPAGKAGEIWFEGFRKDPVTHKVTNTGNDFIHYVAAEILSSPSSSVTASSFSDVAGYTLELENERVRVYRLILNPGQSNKTHNYFLPSLSVAVSEGKILVKSPGHKSRTAEFKPGDFKRYPMGTRLSLKNVGSSRFEAVIFEWK